MKRKKLHDFQILLIFLLCSLVFSILFSLTLFIFDIIPENGNTIVDGLGFWQKLGLVIIIAPFLETAILQAFLLEPFIFYNANEKVLKFAIIASALVFSLTHFFSVYYVIIAFLQGLILAYCYCIFKDRRLPSFLAVFLVHSIYNSLAFIIEEFL